MLRLIFFLPFVAAIDKTVLLNGGSCGIATKLPGGIVVSHDPIDLEISSASDLSCLFSIQSFRPRQAVRLIFEHLTLLPNDCTEANIELYNDKFANDSTKLHSTICPGNSSSGQEYISDGNWLTLKIKADFVSPTSPKVNFTASYSSFSAKPCKFASQETECSTLDRCVYNELLCDGVDGCGDNTDELTTPPANCNATTSNTSPTNTGGSNTAAPGNPGNTDSTTTITTTTTTTTTTASVFPDLTALVAILVIAGVCLSVYIFYLMMTLPWFSALIHSCLRHCLSYGMRRHQDYKRKRNIKAKSLAKISPEVEPPPPPSTE